MKQDQTYLSRDDLQSLLDVLKAEGFRCVGPQVRDVMCAIRKNGMGWLHQNPLGR